MTWTKEKGEALRADLVRLREAAERFTEKARYIPEELNEEKAGELGSAAIEMLAACYRVQKENPSLDAAVDTLARLDALTEWLEEAISESGQGD